MSTPAVQRALDAAFREDRGRVVASLIGRTSDQNQPMAGRATLRRVSRSRVR